METILLGFTPFIVNGVVALTNWFAGTQTTAGKRFILALISLIGVISLNALNGTPVDVNSVSSLIRTAIETLLAFLASHGSYHLFFKGQTLPTTAQ